MWCLLVQRQFLIHTHEIPIIHNKPHLRLNFSKHDFARLISSSPVSDRQQTTAESSIRSWNKVLEGINLWSLLLCLNYISITTATTFHSSYSISDSRELESYNFQKEELRKKENEKLTLVIASFEQAFSLPSLLWQAAVNSLSKIPQLGPPPLLEEQKVH